MIAYYQFYDYDFPISPTAEAPAWSSRVDRWYQLDAYAYGLAQSASHFNSLNLTPTGEPAKLPDLVLLASPEASNRTDYAFAQSGGNSPAKFVHTLPNVRSSAWCQVTGWSGPLLCLQRDPFTLVGALSEAATLLGGDYQEIWVLSVTLMKEGKYRAHQFRLCLAPSSFLGVSPQEILFEMTLNSNSIANVTNSDLSFLNWLSKSQASVAFKLPYGYQIVI